jgi:histidine ammonia-lyase
MNKPEIILDGNQLTIENVGSIAFDETPVSVSADANDRMTESRKVIEEILSSDKTVYGVNTGFGRLSEVRIAAGQLNELQLNLIRSHAAGVGEPFSIPETRAIMALRANVLAKGYSGIRPKVVQLLIEMLNQKIHPIIPSKGSVGASGDLAPLAHLALVLIGEGNAISGSQILPGKLALSEKGLNPVVLQAKEGLALINGTQAMTAIGALSTLRLERLCKIADITGALSADVMKGTDTAFDEKIMGIRPHQGAVAVARNLRNLMKGSKIRESHRNDTHKVQDHYSVRCMPQVHGAVRDALRVAREWITTEINAATDNPLVFSKERQVLSGGNFHGSPIALCLDFLAVAVAQLASISERRTALLVDSSQSELPPFLTAHSGLNSGFMIAQVTSAALVSENKILAHPASVDTIPTSANKEDHVSMGVTAALKLQQMIQNLIHVQAIELLCAAQALDLLAPLETSAPLKKVHQLIRSRVPKMEKDRVIADDIRAIADVLTNSSVIQEAESTMGQEL